MYRTKPGQLIETPSITRSRRDPIKVDHFLDFISSPSYIQDVACGTKTLKLSNGEKMEIPNVVRTAISSRLIHLYHTYCMENILKVKPCFILWFLHAGDCALLGAKCM